MRVCVLERERVSVCVRERVSVFFFCIDNFYYK